MFFFGTEWLQDKAGQKVVSTVNIILLFILFVYVTACKYAYAGANEGQRIISDTLVFPSIGAGNSTQVLWITIT